MSSALSTRTSLFDDVVHGEEWVDERERGAGSLGCGGDADRLRGGGVYVVGDGRACARLVACGGDGGGMRVRGVFGCDVRVVFVATTIADRAGGEIDGEGMGAAAGAGKVVGGAGECEGERVRDGNGRGGEADRVVGGGGHEIASDRAAGGVDDRLAGVEGSVGGGRYRDWETDRKSTRLNSSHSAKSRMPSSA